MIDICFLFSVNRDETRAIDGDAGVFCTNQAAVGLTADRDKYLVELFYKGGTFVFEDDVEPSVCCADMACLLYTSPSPRDQRGSRMPSSA